jgi:hypothetical protein
VRTALVCNVLVLAVLLAPALRGQDRDDESRRDSVVTAPGVKLIARTTMAVNYKRGETTHIDITGTDLTPQLTGKAKIINKSGLTDIHVDVENVPPAHGIDVAYLTYVLRTVSPQGQAKNAGELIAKDGKASLHTTTNLQAFALVKPQNPTSQ